MLTVRFKLVFFCPQQATRTILDHIFQKYPREAGNIGQYEQCAFISHGTGQFVPGAGTRPSIGERGRLVILEEDRVEFVINDKGDGEDVRNVVRELKSVHPYEEVAFDVYKLEDFS